MTQRLTFLTSTSAASTMLQKESPTGVWKSPIPDASTTTQADTQTDGDVFIQHIKVTRYVLPFLWGGGVEVAHGSNAFFLISKAAKHLTSTHHSELTEAQCKVLNQDWLEYPHLRYCCSHCWQVPSLLKAQHRSSCTPLNRMDAIHPLTLTMKDGCLVHHRPFQKDRARMDS